MKFNIDPPSGYPNSYLDVRFVLEFDAPYTGDIWFENNTTGETLDILSVSSGRIAGENTISLTGALKADGFISLFNGDRMNVALSKYAMVTITCHSSLGQVEADFYNEAQSLDAGIIPFELQVVNPNINLDANEPLELVIKSGEEKKYELAIKSQVGKHTCTIEIICRKGINHIKVPCEFLFSDLAANEFRHDKYLIHYVKFQGLDYSGYVARHYIPIRDAVIRFLGTLLPAPQSRNGPDGDELSKDFVLSDRYLVPTFRDFSSFGRRMENVVLVCNLPRFTHEAQDLQDRKKTMTASSVSLKTLPAQNKEYDIKTGQLFRYVNTNLENRLFYEDLVGKVYSTSTNQVQPSAASTKTGGCGCSRNKK